MYKYRVTYRTLRGSVESTIILATSEQNAISLFSARYDGRVITVDFIGQ